MEASARVFERFIERLPNRPYCTDDLTKGLRVRPAKKALERRYIQPNRPNTVGYMMFDMDKPLSEIAYQVADLPRPTLTIVNPKNGHAHLGYELKAPVYSGSSNQNPFRWLKAIQAGYCNALQADPCYVGLITKNPFSPHWEVNTYDETYELGYLAEFIELGTITRRSANDDSALGRNDSLFNATRRNAYRWVHECTSEEQLFIKVYNAASNYNAERFATPLYDAEVRCTARSITKWTWKNRDRIGKGRQRKLELDTTLPLEERRRLGAMHTNAKQRAETEAKIIQAIEAIIASKTGRVTKALVSRLTGLHRKTLENYSHLFKYITYD